MATHSGSFLSPRLGPRLCILVLEPDTAEVQGVFVCSSVTTVILARESGGREEEGLGLKAFSVFSGVLVLALSGRTD